MQGKISITANLRMLGTRIVVFSTSAWVLSILILDSITDPNGVMVAMLGILVIFLPAAALIGVIALVVGAALADHKA